MSQWNAVQRQLPSRSEFIAEAVVTIVITASGVAWAHLAQWAAPLVLLFGVGLLGVTLFAVNQFNLIALRRELRWDDDRLRRFCREMLDGMKLRVSRVESPEVSFRYDAELLRGPEGDKRLVLGFSVVKFVQDSDLLTFGMSATIAENDWKFFETLQPTERLRILATLRVEAVQFGASYQGIGQPLRQITLEEKVPLVNGVVDERAFLNAVQRTRNVEILVNQVLAREFARAKLGGAAAPLPPLATDGTSPGSAPSTS